MARKGFVFSNWAGTSTARPTSYFEPEDETQLRQILKEARTNKLELKVIGGGHSPSDIACTDGVMVSLKKMNKILDVDTKSCSITVQAGVQIDYLNEHVLPENGLSFQNLGSVSELSVGGIIATGTHGTGSEFGSFASCVLELWIMKSDGNVAHCSKSENKELFSAACCHLGLLGIVLSAKLQCEPAFNLHECHVPCSLDYILENFDELASSSQHFRAMWFPHTDRGYVKFADRTKKTVFEQRSWILDTFFGYYILEFCLWISTFFPSLVPAINIIFYKICYSWKRQIIQRSDRVFNINCLFKQYTAEWAIPRQHTVQVIKRMKRWVAENNDASVHFPVEIRVVKRDKIMLSPSGDCDVTCIGIISFKPYGKVVSHDRLWNFFQQLCKEVGGKPHWAKDHEEKLAYLKTVYKNFDDFMAIREQVDPTRMFINNYWRRILNE